MIYSLNNQQENQDSTESMFPILQEKDTAEPNIELYLNDEVDLVENFDTQNFLENQNKYTKLDLPNDKFQPFFEQIHEIKDNKERIFDLSGYLIPIHYYYSKKSQYFNPFILKDDIYQVLKAKYFFITLKKILSISYTLINMNSQEKLTFKENLNGELIFILDLNEIFEKRLDKKFIKNGSFIQIYYQLETENHKIIETKSHPFIARGDESLGKKVRETAKATLKKK